jgi:archaellum biogenesis ATPase FlaH
VLKLRHDAPGAYIFLITSPSLTDEPGKVPMRSVQKAYLDEVVQRLGDQRIQVVQIAHYEGVPGDWHPSGTAHRAVANELEPVIRKVMSW